MSVKLSEQELRALVRDVVARQRAANASAADTSVPSASSPAADACVLHVSHWRLELKGGGDADGRCVIEPAAVCNHCGYCQSLGH
jgi:hypothetical protein